MENTNEVVNEEEMTSLPISEDIKTQSVAQDTEVKEETSVQPAIQAGDKTPPNALLKSLQEEREKRRMLEEEIQSLKSSALPVPEVYSDEAKVLADKIGSLESVISEMRTENQKKDLLISQPILKEKWDEFEEFRADPENKGMNMRTAAKAFLVENGLLEVPRKGLEKPTGGSRVPMASGMTAEDVDTLRQTNYRKYIDMLKKGQIKIAG